MGVCHSSCVSSSVSKDAHKNDGKSGNGVADAATSPALSNIARGAAATPKNPVDAKTDQMVGTSTPLDAAAPPGIADSSSGTASVGRPVSVDADSRLKIFRKSSCYWIWHKNPDMAPHLSGQGFDPMSLAEGYPNSASSGILASSGCTGSAPADGGGAADVDTAASNCRTAEQADPGPDPEQEPAAASGSNRSSNCSEESLRALPASILQQAHAFGGELGPVLKLFYWRSDSGFPIRLLVHLLNGKKADFVLMPQKPLLISLPTGLIGRFQYRQGGEGIDEVFEDVEQDHHQSIGRKAIVKFGGNLTPSCQFAVFRRIGHRTMCFSSANIEGQDPATPLPERKETAPPEIPMQSESAEDDAAAFSRPPAKELPVSPA